MSDVQVIKDLILSAIPNAKQAATGFYTTRCPVCNDSKVRGGVRFDEDKIIWNCFRGRCDSNCVYEQGKYVSRKFRTLLNALGVELPTDIALRGRSKAREILNRTLYEPHHYKAADLPKDFEVYDPNRHKAYHRYLTEVRQLDDTEYLIGNRREWKDRLIIPFWLGDKLIGWQGYDPFKRKMVSYLKCSSNSDLLYFPDGNIPDEPIIVEGVFDAKSVPNGVATLQSTITRKQAYFLRNKKPILVPDRKDSRFIEVARMYGWRVSVPEFDEEDIDAARRKYGRLALAKMIHDGIKRDIFEAEVSYRLWRKN